MDDTLLMYEATRRQNLMHDPPNQDLIELVLDRLERAYWQQLVDAVDVRLRFLDLNDSCDMRVTFFQQNFNLFIHLFSLLFADLPKSILLNDND
jgi:hypothetical protein